MKHEFLTDPTGTVFSLEAGTRLTLGQEVITLAEQTDVRIDRSMPYDAVVETIFGSGDGNAAANSEAVAHDEIVNGKTVRVTYGAFAQRVETPFEDLPGVDSESESETEFKSDAELQAESDFPAFDPGSEVEEDDSESETENAD